MKNCPSSTRTRADGRPPSSYSSPSQRHHLPLLQIPFAPSPSPAYPGRFRRVPALHSTATTPLVLLLYRFHSVDNRIAAPPQTLASQIDPPLLQQLDQPLLPCCSSSSSPTRLPGAVSSSGGKGGEMQRKGTFFWGGSSGATARGDVAAAPLLRACEGGLDWVVVLQRRGFWCATFVVIHVRSGVRSGT